MVDAMTETEHEHDDAQTRQTPTRHAMLMRGVVTPLFGLLAVACVVFGVLNSTIWKPTRDIQATGDVKDHQYVLTDPGVLNLVDQRVQISAHTNNSDEVCIAVGSTKDAVGWVQGSPYDRVTGLQEWNTLSLESEQAHGTPNPQDSDVAFKDSNMWSRIECGSGNISVVIDKAQPSQVAIVDFGSQVKQGTVVMQWTRTTVPDFAMPLYVSGGLCAVLAVLAASIFAMPPAKRRKNEKEVVAQEQEEEQRKQENVSIGEAVAGTLKSFTRAKPRVDAKPRRRHSKHSAEHPQGDDALATQESQEVAEVAEETTTVISANELQEYFARLAQEEASHDQDSTDVAKENKQ